ncbi:MAG: (Fe-S)-binding protein [Bacteroidota bacterium]
MRVTLFIPCLVDSFYPATGIAMVEILRRVGVEVDYRTSQTCCGQPAMNTGYRHDARAVAARWLKVFDRSQYIVAPSGSCVGMVRNLYNELFEGGLSEDQKALCARTFEFSEFLVKILKIYDVGARFEERVTYHDACHLLHELGIKDEPRILLRNVKGLEFVEMEDSTRCCGFGGTFAVKFPELSTVMVKQKVAAIEKSGARYVVANDSSCLMNIEGYLRRHQSMVKSIHLTEILARQ